jgi:hypothetical protein
MQNGQHEGESMEVEQGASVPPLPQQPSPHAALKLAAAPSDADAGAVPKTEDGTSIQEGETANGSAGDVPHAAGEEDSNGEAHRHAHDNGEKGEGRVGEQATNGGESQRSAPQEGEEEAAPSTIAARKEEEEGETKEETHSAEVSHKEGTNDDAMELERDVKVEPNEPNNNAREEDDEEKEKEHQEKEEKKVNDEDDLKAEKTVARGKIEASDAGRAAEDKVQVIIEVVFQDDALGRDPKPDETVMEEIIEQVGAEEEPGMTTVADAAPLPALKQEEGSPSTASSSSRVIVHEEFYPVDEERSVHPPPFQSWPSGLSFYLVRSVS